MMRFSRTFLPLLVIFFIPLMMFAIPSLQGNENQLGRSQGKKSSKSLSKPEQTVQVIFQVDMSQWAAKGKFNPATDSIDLPGTFNNWTNSATLQRIDTSLVYGITLYIDSLTVQQFRFRIDRDSSRTELSSGTYRYFRVPSHPITVKYMFNNFDTTTVPILFKCDMYYQIRAGHFNPNPYEDFLDIAGTWNNWGAYDLLFDTEHDSIFQISMNLPKSLISPYTPIEFKFRINGNWNTAEFPGNGTPRKYFLQDTVGGNQNVVTVWYDDENPTIPTPPWAYNLYIQGPHYVGQALTGAYTYEDINLHPEGVSIYKWYRADSVTQVNPELRTLDTTINYILDTTDYKKYIAFEVTPVAKGTGDSLVGKPVRIWTGPIVSVGIGELTEVKPEIFPNPVINTMTFNKMNDFESIEIYSALGQKIITLQTTNSDRMIYNASALRTGVYFIRFIKKDQTYQVEKFIKNQ